MLRKMTNNFFSTQSFSNALLFIWNKIHKYISYRKNKSFFYWIKIKVWLQHHFTNQASLNSQMEFTSTFLKTCWARNCKEEKITRLAKPSKLKNWYPKISKSNNWNKKSNKVTWTSSDQNKSLKNKWGKSKIWYVLF